MSSLPLSLLSTLFAPHVCSVCGATTLPEEERICEQCLYRLPSYRDFGQRMSHIADRFLRRIPFYSANALLRYERSNRVAMLVHDMKYNRCPSLAFRLGERLGSEFSATTLSLTIDAVMPMPVHFTRRMKRGYNQTELLAIPLARALGVPVLKNLRTRRPHATQTRKSTAERQTGVSPDLFRIHRPESLEGKHLLLLDDVITTGSTMAAAAKALNEAVPSANISLLALSATDY